MDLDELNERLAAGEIVSVERDSWEAVRPRFEVVEEHDTMMRGMLLVVRAPFGLAAVEEPNEDLRVLRPLGDPAAATAFVKDRLATYDRMWDGCGCKVDYFT